MSRLITINDVAERVGVSKRTVYRWINEGNFPTPMELSARIRKWTEQEVEDWIKKKVEQREWD